MATELEELIGFLSSPSPQLRKAAIEIVQGLTGSDEGIQTLASHASLALPPLCRLLFDSSLDFSSASADALINLSQVPDLASKLVSLGVVAASMEVMYKRPELAQKLVMLLVNLTQVEAGVNALLQVGDEKMEGLYVSKLVRSFCRSSSADSGEDAFEHVASVLINISKAEAGRRVLLEPKRGLLKQVMRQSDSTNPIRKKGVCSTIRNCCFEADNQLQNLLIIAEYLWPALLLPVSGKKIYSEEDRSKMPPELSNVLSHEREVVEDPEIRQEALEAIYMISMQEAGRKALWAVNGPRILQVGYEDEEDPKVMEAYEQIGSLLVGNDGAE
ncbi:ARM repeat superfamily protein [Rhynchospora pubera]|uniref:Protein HGH1 homolog n=1 Tax=Rhynchospora pubera TaxID=906938 RepID=A0AAV8C7P7_9POAL|nr:ARM repeat superfamily protein [Rhynchospora pubera]